MGERPDAETLLKRAMGGDRESLVALLEEVGPRVRARIETKITGGLRSVLDADDVMQVTYLEVVLRIDRFTTGGPSGFLAWVTRMAENNLTDAVRSLEAARRPDPRKRVQGNRSNEDSYVSLVEMLGATSMTPSRVAAKGEAARFLDAALSKLPPDYAKVVRLYDLEGRPMPEVAKELGRSEGAAYMLRARAHDRLREAMGSEARFFSTPS